VAVIGGVKFPVRPARPPSRRNLCLSKVAWSSAIGRTRHCRVRIGACRSWRWGRPV